jgi:hypothetical protein
MPKGARQQKVTIVGSGIAGLTTAYRLAQRGYDISIIEAQTVAGGNLAGAPSDDGAAVFEVYPHMFGQWYSNFWKLMADIGVTRENAFKQLPVCGFLRSGQFPHYRLLQNCGSPRTMIDNLLSGIMSIPNMFLAAYTIIDLLTQDFAGDSLLSDQSVNGFVITRPYATESVAEFFELLILNIWSADSYLTAAGAYQKFAQYQFRSPTPQCWVVRTNSSQAIIEPLRMALERILGKDPIRRGERVTGVTVNPANNRVTQISIKAQETETTTEQVENLVLAVPPTALPELVMKIAAIPERAAPRDLLPTTRAVPIVHFLPELADTRRLTSEPIPVVYAFFKRALTDIPEYYVALTGSRYSLTFVKVTALTAHNDGNTVLAVAASDFNALPVDLKFLPTLVRAIPSPEQAEAMFLILSEFSRFVTNFNVGKHWDDPDSDIDWVQTRIGTGANQQLFINQVGSQQTLPYTHYPQINNLYFAGENRNNPISIATVEAAVCSGNQAAQAICRDHGQAAGIAPVEVLQPDTYPMALLLAWKLGLAPYAALAKCWAVAEELAGGYTGGQRRAGQTVPRAAPSLFRQGAAVASNAYCAWWNICGALVGEAVRGIGRR